MNPIRDWMDRHAIDYRVAATCGLHGENGTLYAPYTPTMGETFERYRKFPDGVWKQPKGQELSLYWPLGRAWGAHVLLCEGEGDTLAAASILADTDHPQLNGLCPVGLPGATMNAERVAADLDYQGTKKVFVCLDADEAGTKATERIVGALTRISIPAFPVGLPTGFDLADFIMDARVRANTAIQTFGVEYAEDQLAHLIADAEIIGEQAREKILMADIEKKLGI